MTIKKVFNEVNELLVANSTKLVSEIMPQLLALMSAKTGGSETGSTCYKNEQGEVIAVFCYYHKKWELVSEHEYGAKVGTTTGLNSMCKLGVNQWTKQQREFKQAQTKLLSQLASGELQVSDLASVQAELEEKKSSVVFVSNYKPAYDSLDDLKSNVISTEPNAIKVESEVIGEDRVEVPAVNKKIRKTKSKV